MYVEEPCCEDCVEGLAGLGVPPAVYRGIETGANLLVPGSGEAMEFARNAWNAIENFFNIGAGRQEADVIVEVQNQVNGQLDQITQALVRNPNVQGLQNLYQQVSAIGFYFLQFISDDRFVDGRASEQAANTIMPYIDGTCGYRWPPPLEATQTGCLRWGDGTPGGPGMDGMLGAIRRAILRLGGTVPPPLLTQGGGTLYPSLQPQGSQNFPWLPQAGTLPNTSPLSPIQPASVPTLSAGLGSIPAILLGGAAIYLFRRRKS